MRQYSLKTLFGLMAAFCVSLALTRVSHVVGGAAMIGYVVIVAIFGKDAFQKRALIYGSVVGVILFVLVALSIASVVGEWPIRSYSTPQITMSFARQYEIPIGGFIGAVAGWIYAGRRSQV